MSNLQVIYINYWYEPAMTSPDDLLATYVTMARWTEALREQGAEVAVFQRFRQNAVFERGGVRFVMHRDRHAPHLPKWVCPFSFHRRVRERTAALASPGTPTAIHFNGLHFPVQLRALRAALPRPAAIVVQHHAESPAHGMRRRVQTWGLRAADGFFFAARELASDWIAERIIPADRPVYQVMEGSNDFRRQDRAAARARTGLSGDPVLLWVGRLIPLKDPLTVLRGFEEIVQARPAARLYMAYGSEDLLTAVQDRIAQNRLLSRSVTLLGYRPHAELESLYNSADYFVLGSHREGSGYALAEALACGVVPVVTDIPAFRALTDGGSLGALWPPGDSAALAAAFRRAEAMMDGSQADRAAKFFEKHLSFPAIARAAVAAYRELAAKRADRIP